MRKLRPRAARTENVSWAKSSSQRELVSYSQSVWTT